MNKTVLVILTIVGILILVNLIYMTGISRKVEETIKPEATPLISTLSRLGGLKMVSQWSFVVDGQVKEINNRTITLLRGSESLVIELAEDAAFVRTVSEKGKEARLVEITLEDVKIGDQVVISVAVNSDGIFGGRRLRVRP